HLLTGLAAPFLAADAQRNLTAFNLKSFLLPRMDVFARHETAGPHAHVDAQQFAVRVAAGEQERHQLAGHRVLNRLTLVGQCAHYRKTPASVGAGIGRDTIATPQHVLEALVEYVSERRREFQTTLRVLQSYPEDQRHLRPSEKSRTAAELVRTLVIEE